MLHVSTVRLERIGRGQMRIWLTAWILCGCVGLGLERASGAPLAPGSLPEVEVSVPRGCYQAPFSLRLTSPIAEATLRYTDDGSEPTPVHGKDYREPISIT